MEAIKYDLTALDCRFVRLRQVIETEKQKVNYIENRVKKCFREGDLQGISRLSEERIRVLRLTEKIERFVDKWEKQWQEYEHAADWIQSE